MNPLSRVQVGKSRLHIMRLGLGGRPWEVFIVIYQKIQRMGPSGALSNWVGRHSTIFQLAPKPWRKFGESKIFAGIIPCPLRRPPFNSRWPIPRLRLSSQGRGRELKWRKTFGWLDIPSRPNPGPTCAGRNYGPRKHLFPLKRTPETQGCLKTDFAVDSNLDEHKRIRRVHLA
jgi:hypothetical protein